MLLASAEIDPHSMARDGSAGVRDGLAVLAWHDAEPLWRSALSQFSGASLYHREPWLRALRDCYGLDLRTAVLFRSGELRAATTFARCPGIRSARMVSLPFSDQGEVLAADHESRAELMRALAQAPVGKAMEVRGVSGPRPWVNVDCFLHWQVDISRPFDRIYPTLGSQLRTKTRKARRNNVTIERANSLEFMRRFYELQLETRRRLGVPPQPFCFFEAVHQAFAPSGCEIWFASHRGRIVAGLVVLHDGDTVYYKWSARREDGPAGASHLLGMNLIEEYAGHARFLDLGRSDARNQGLNQFKTGLGARPSPLPYAFLPSAPRHVSSEVMTSKPARLARAVWRRLPLEVTRVAGEVLYRYLA